MRIALKVALAAAAVIGGAVAAQLIQLPIPWLLGPMIVTALLPYQIKSRFVWPKAFRNFALIIVGYTIGLSMTMTALQEMLLQLPYMLLMTFLLLLYCTGIAYVMAKWGRIDIRTALLASVPGGMTQVLSLAEESKGVDLTVVTITQVIRLMMIIVIMPFLVLSSFAGDAQAPAAAAREALAASPVWSVSFATIAIYAVACICLAIGAAKIRLPTAYLPGPVIGAAFLQGIGLEAWHLPAYLLQAAQLVLGVYIGLMLNLAGLPGKFKMVALAIGSACLLVAGAWGLSEILTLLEPDLTLSTTLLSLAPGGSDQMGLLAHEIRADLSIVSGYQLFRTFFIMFAVPPLLRLLFKYLPANDLRSKQPSSRPF